MVATVRLDDNLENTLNRVSKILHKKKIPNVLIKDENKNYYIVTDSDFREKVILKKMDFDDKLIKLNHSQEEVNSIGNLLSGDVYKDSVLKNVFFNS